MTGLNFSASKQLGKRSNKWSQPEIFVHFVNLVSKLLGCFDSFNFLVKSTGRTEEDCSQTGFLKEKKSNSLRKPYRLFKSNIPEEEKRRRKKKCFSHWKFESSGALFAVWGLMRYLAAQPRKKRGT